ncbi:MAG: lipopolysaccharide biosynthesis protein [Candidatus Krumholzibacteria bacterium]|nr:lipopolysaccharide biosynthesis protein [Candidatus Krumholzibacteria bacterium]
MTDGQPSLRRNFSWTFFGNVVFAACLWGILSFLTKMGSPDIVGRFALGSAIATPAIMFANLQLRVVLATDAKTNHEFRDYLGIRLLLLPAALLIVVVIAVLGYNREQALVIAMFGLVRCVESLSDIFYGFAQKHERMDLVARSLWIRGISALALFGGVFWLTGDLAFSLGGMAVAWLLTILFFDWPSLRHMVKQAGESGLRPRLRRDVVRNIVWLALPLGLVMLLINLRNTIPRAFLESSFGEEQLGIFSALSYLVIAGSTVIMALSQSSIARLSRYYAEGRREQFQSTIIKLLGLGVVIGIFGVLVAALAGKPLLTLLYSEEYAGHTGLFVVIMIGGALLYLGSLLGAPVSAMREFRVQLWVYLVNVVLMLGFSVWAIPKYGMMGAAVVMVVCSLWVTSAYGFLVWRGIHRMEIPVDGVVSDRGGDAG